MAKAWIGLDRPHPLSARGNGAAALQKFGAGLLARPPEARHWLWAPLAGGP